ncbi:MAG: PIN domain-containing protein [Actinomycetota bacterium]
MAKGETFSILVDTSFLVPVFDSTRGNHADAKRYYKYFCDNSYRMFLSTIVISEFHQKQTIVPIYNTGNFIVLPFNYEDAIKAADIAYQLGGLERGGEPKAKYKDDLKIMAQAETRGIDFIITEDRSTLARYVKKLSDAKLYRPSIIVLNDGYDISIFNKGQAPLPDKTGAPVIALQASESAKDK